MLNTAPDICCKIIADLMNAIISEGQLPAEWNDSVIVSSFKGIDALDQNNYHGLTFTDHVLKVIERAVKNIICDTVNFDEMQFGFCPS